MGQRGRREGARGGAEHLLLVNSPPRPRLPLSGLVSSAFLPVRTLALFLFPENNLIMKNEF